MDDIFIYASNNMTKIDQRPEKSKDNKNIIIGGGPAGLFSAYFLLKSGKRDVTVYEARNHLGGDWYADLPRYTHSTMVLFKEGYSINIFTEVYNYLYGTKLTQEEWLNNVSYKTDASIINEVLKNIDITDLFKMVGWFISNRQVYTKSVKQMIKETKLSKKGINICKMLCNLGVDGIDNTSAGTLQSMIINQIRPSKMLMGKINVAYHLKIPKRELWNMMRSAIIKMGGKIELNRRITINNENIGNPNINATKTKGIYSLNDYVMSPISINVHKNNGYFSETIKLEKGDKIVVATGVDVLQKPDDYQMRTWAKINIPNYPPVGRVLSVQFLFEDSLDRSLMDEYNVLSGINTDWNIIVSIDGNRPLRGHQKDSLLVATVIGVDAKSSFTNKSVAESTTFEIREEILRQIKAIPSLRNYVFPTCKKKWGGLEIKDWAHTGTIPNQRIQISEHEYIHWASFLRTKSSGISNLNTAAESAIMITKEITGKEMIKLDQLLPVWFEYLLLIVLLCTIYIQKNKIFNFIGYVFSYIYRLIS